MKKILIILLCFYIGSVSAEEYSDYSNFSDYIDKEVQSDDLTDVKIERRYKYYKLVKELGPYEKENITNDAYPYIDYDDYTYSEESDYLDEKPALENGRIITTHTLHHHLKADDITYIKLYNSNNKNVDLYYSNFTITYKDKPLEYNVNYKNASDNVINQYGEILINFNEKIDERYLNISFEMTASSENRADLYLTTGNNEVAVGQARYIFGTTNTSNIKIQGINMDTYSNAFVDYYSDKIETTTPTIHYTATVTRYTYKDTLYRKYNLVRKYTDSYLTQSIDDYIYKDEEKYKDYYAYRTRSIIEKGVPDINDKVQIDTKKEEKKENIVLKLLKPKSEKNIITNQTPMPSPLLQIEPKKLSTSTNKTKELQKENIPVYYLSYILIIIVILILLLSKLYKKYKKSVNV